MTERGQVGLVAERRFGPFFGVQFLRHSLFARNRAKLRHLLKLFPRIRLAVGEPLPPEAVTPQRLHAAVAGLRGAWR